MQNFFDVNAPTDQELDQLAGFIAGMEDFASSNNGSDYRRVSPVQQIKKQKWPLPTRPKPQDRSPSTIVDLVSDDEEPVSSEDVTLVDYVPATLDNLVHGLRHFPEAERERLAVNHLAVRKAMIQLTCGNVVVEEEDSDDDDMNMRHAPTRLYRASACRPRCVCENAVPYYRNYCGHCHGWIAMNYH